MHSLFFFFFTFKHLREFYQHLPLPYPPWLQYCVYVGIARLIQTQVYKRGKYERVKVCMCMLSLYHDKRKRDIENGRCPEGNSERSGNINGSKLVTRSVARSLAKPLTTTYATRLLKDKLLVVC